MVGVGKLMKQAAKMQQQLQTLQDEMAQTVIEVSGGGGAVNIKITLQQEIKAIQLDPEFLKEDRQLIEETLTEAVREAVNRSKAQSEEKMSAITSGFSLPGMF
ncbi:MAG: YbaB/EbfC family nucleoid-associated protein [Verrucomicrobiota bacterium JB022]|nr:YbaB/EbfC family nucleoid-associated protein [Verrucomicrobiota bacterium JB022]